MQKMMKIVSNTVVAAILVVATGFFSGCDEPDVGFIIDEEEIIAYIQQADTGSELFRQSNLMLSVPYTYHLDTDAVYTDLIDSVKRIFTVTIAADSIEESLEELFNREYTIVEDIGPPYYETKTAEVRVQDLFYIRTRRVHGQDTTFTYFTRRCTRYGYFVKAGSDDNAFSGWILVAYNGGGTESPDPVTVVRPDLSTFTGDGRFHTYRQSVILDISGGVEDTITANYNTRYEYVDLSGDPQIARVALNQELDIRVENLPADEPVIFNITAQTPGGYKMVGASSAAGDVFSASITTPVTTQNSWDIIFVQSYRPVPADTTSVPPIANLVHRSWCIPYKVVR